MVVVVVTVIRVVVVMAMFLPGMTVAMAMAMVVVVFLVGHCQTGETHKEFVNVRLIHFECLMISFDYSTNGTLIRVGSVIFGFM